MTDSYLRPIPLLDPANADGAHSLAGGWVRFTQMERLRRGYPPEILPAADVHPTALAPFLSARMPIAGLSFDGPRIMGILNVTPDSFSDGGRHDTRDAALARATAMIAEGADLIDLGGESTRPGADLVPLAEEVRRTGPVIEAMRASGLGVPISLDTRKAPVAAAGLALGAAIINDVSGLRFDPELAHVVAAGNAALILMHSIGTPDDMQDLAEEAYTDVLLDAYDVLEAAVGQAEAAGVPRSRIMVDPGIGFGKTLDQNLALLKRISLFHGLGCAILLGVSRKRMIGTLSDTPEADRRGPGSAALGLWAVSQGIQMLRVHDISLHKQALALWQAVAE